MVNTTKTKGMNVSMTPELENFVDQLVDSGRYSSRSEAVRAALRLLEDQERLRAVKLEALREKIQEGLNSGSATPLDMEKVKKEARAEWEGGKSNEE